MRKAVIDLDNNKEVSQEAVGKIKRKQILHSPTKAEQADSMFLPLGSFFNILSKHNKKPSNGMDSDNSETVYLPAIYVEFLHEIIIKLYEKSDDYVLSGYMSKPNLEYTMEYVKDVYYHLKNQKILFSQ